MKPYKLNRYKNTVFILIIIACLFGKEAKAQIITSDMIRITKVKKVYQWNQFYTLGSTISYYGPVLKITGGAVKRFGAYGSLETNFRFISEPDYIYYGGSREPFWSGESFSEVFSFTVGGVFRIVPGWMINMGGGYAKTNIYRKTISDNIILYDNWRSGDDVKVEFGNMLYFGKFLFSTGIAYSFKTENTEFNIGIGIIF